VVLPAVDYLKCRSWGRDLDDERLNFVGQDTVSSRRHQIGRIRRAGEGALGRFGLERPALRLLRHEHNTTFRVDVEGSTFVLRIHRQGVHRSETINSELAWLRALNVDTDLGVPEPVVALDGSPVVLVPDPGGHEPLAVVLFRWQPGRFVDKRLTPGHLRQVAVLQAGLQRHAAGWERPEGFLRPRVDTLTSAAKKSSIALADDSRGPHPSSDDADASLALVDELLSRADTDTVAQALQIVRATTGDVAKQPATIGLIHADLHYENVLFHNGRARAIDFDDCGWGSHLYDLAVTLSELEGHDRYPQLRDALLEEYAHHLPLPTNHHDQLNALILLRRVQLVIWILESRHHAAFGDWDQWARTDIRHIAVALRHFE
jgi:Ser/Thr protein kinase RdoA (MazF antagonist)